MLKKIITLVCLFISFFMWSQVRPIKTKWQSFNHYGMDVIVLPTYGSYNYLIKKSGNDGVVISKGVIGSPVVFEQHFISLFEPGIYEIEITPTVANSFKFYFNEIIEQNDADLLANMRRSFIELSQWGNQTWNSNLNYMFQGCSNLTITATDAPNLANVNSLSGFFQEATTFNGDISSWDVSMIKNMSNMFYKASSFNGNISNWNVSNVTNMRNMFVEAISFNQDLSNWDVSKVTDMSSMFLGAKAFNTSINTWNTSNVENMSNMFRQASSFNKPLSNWNTSKVRNMTYMFSLASEFNQDISNFDVSNVTDLSYMFNGALKFNSNINSWNVSGVSNMNSMFRGALAYNQPLNNWDVSNVRNMEAMFENATAFNQPLDNWNLLYLINVKSMFKGARIFNQDISNFNFESVTSANSFLDISGLDCSNYSKLLNSLAFHQTVKDNVTFSAQNLNYGEQGFLARKQLVNAKGWVISDLDILDETCNDSFLSIEDDLVATPTKLSFYPNPVDDNLFIQSANNVRTVNIFTLEGKLLSTSTGTNTINMNSLSKGIYIVKVTFSDGVIHHEKIVKK